MCRETTREGSAPADNRRERLLLTAERLFAERGFHNVAVREIADEAGVTHPLIYYYWSSKDELLAAVIERTQSRIRRAARSDDALDLLTAIARDYLQSNRRYLLTITRAFVDGMSASEWPGRLSRGRGGRIVLSRAGRAGAGGRRGRVRERIAVLTAMLTAGC